ncbi:alanine racemase [Microbacterium sp. Au-Mic1]|uniref:alanine racemase n=1 Tax=Microbacterium sp. Au-Mic1 TaxID=2906457 RepID=UPI001E5CCB77|nr:alanine racemase [Microbacterium sp. Au-Mic1]MCE4026812.1 alanine racemase [Microbacterium sp. Au-Mic1]
MRSPASELVVHEDALRENTDRFRALTGGRLMAVLKADAFGHGDIAAAVLESGAGSIGVTSIDEALALRQAGIDAPILSWLNTPDADVETALHLHVDLAAPNLELLFAIAGSARATGTTARVHLHVDVGTGRDGCPPKDWASLCALAREQEAAGAIRVVGVMGHLSCADDPGNGQNVRERLVFENAVRTARRRGLRPHLLHLAATAATLTGTAAGYDLHRIGAGLFGIDPSRTTDDLRPALTLTSTVVSSREAPAGTGVGYGHDFVTSSRTCLALLPLGYADGLPRAASGRAEVLVHGERRPLVGRFSMDMVVVDTGDRLLRPGERVTIFGPGRDGAPTVAEWAAWARTIEHEIVTGVGARASRIRRTLDASPRTPHPSQGETACLSTPAAGSPSSEAARITSTRSRSRPRPASHGLSVH